MTSTILDAVTIVVHGTPAPQGSKRAFVVNGRAIVAEDNKRTKPWRHDVVAAVRDLFGDHIDQVGGLTGPLELGVVFLMPRPRYHYGTGKNADRLKDSAPTYCDKKPDVDKLVRSTCDALTASGIYRDDAQVTRLVVEQRYADTSPGAHITIKPLTDPVSAADRSSAADTATSQAGLF